MVLINRPTLSYLGCPKSLVRVLVFLSFGSVLPLHYSGLPWILFILHVLQSINFQATSTQMGTSKHHDGDRAYFLNLFSEKRTTHIPGTVFLVTSLVLFQIAFAHIYKRSYRIVDIRNEYVLCTWNALCLSIVLAKYNILPPRASFPNLSPLNMPQGLIATVKCIDGCLREVLSLFYSYSMNVTLANDEGVGKLINWKFRKFVLRDRASKKKVLS